MARIGQDQLLSFVNVCGLGDAGALFRPPAHPDSTMPGGKFVCLFPRREGNGWAVSAGESAFGFPGTPGAERTRDCVF